MAGLQPLHIFKSEIARVNELYWSSSYAYDRTCQLLSFLETTGNYSSDPLVKEVWGAKNYALDRVSKTNLAEFSNILMVKNSEALRINSILHLCSAFENALSGYYFLCSLYDGRKGDASYKGDDVPLILKTAQKFDSRRKSISKFLESKNSPLKGKYTERLKVLTLHGALRNSQAQACLDLMVIIKLAIRSRMTKGSGRRIIQSTVQKRS